MSIKRKKPKMTINTEPAELDITPFTADNNNGIEKMEVDHDDERRHADEDDGSDDLEQILGTLENTSGLKLVKYVVLNCKHVCKILSRPENLQVCKELSENIGKICRRHVKNHEKGESFSSKVLAKTESTSCDSDMFRTYLKYGLKSPENSQCGSSLVGILQGIISVAAYLGLMENPTLGIQMIVSHSEAANIFLESHTFVKKSNPNPKLQPQPTKQQLQTLAGEGDQAPRQEKFSDMKTQLLKLWKSLVISFTKISKHGGTENDKKILENSVPYLLQMYTATRSEGDLEIFEILHLYSGKKLQISIESMSLFGPKCFEPVPKGASNPLFAHSSKANNILNLINDEQAFKTAMEYNESVTMDNANSKHYDFKFLLPLVCHALDARNICDAKRVISNGWIYLIVRALSFEEDTLRNLAFLAYKLLVQNFQLPKKGFQMQDIKIWLHFLLSVRKGFQNLGKCKVSNLVSIWMVSTWEAVRQPTHPMYQSLTTFLFAKPVIDLNVLPDFQPFYNAANGNSLTREWILKILSHGLQTKEDWQVAQRNPTINSLCCSFLVETILVQREILRIFSEGAKIPEVAQEMVDKHSLLIWMANVPTSSNRHLYKRELLNLFQSLKENCSHNEGWESMFQYVANNHGWCENDANQSVN